ncbi:pistil-specific extensin-like protein [Diospyros lotus]|uniref:pistil-specific extensin-like protein n=1 Tax=Diospyros lotus TaxID=55363 RepID=UPI00224FB149|nr:pistil-specific extensin-like protein [Diospyros lotus]
MGALTTYLMMVGAWSIVLMGSWINGSDALKEEAAGTVYVGGKVLCQDCTQGWNEWIHGAKPIKGCMVSITCMDGGRVAYYGSDETDEGEAFEMSLKKSINGKPLDLKKCSVRLVSSPDPVCNIPTDFAGGRSGVWLRRPTVVYRDLIKHVLGPFYYTTPMCEEPDTNQGFR